MNKKYTRNFAEGLFIGILLCACFWYWQKSTAAEDGALALLDRLAQSEAERTRLQAQLGTTTPPRSA